MNTKNKVLAIAIILLVSVSFLSAKSAPGNRELLDWLTISIAE
jgi:hypothetical protein